MKWKELEHTYLDSDKNSYNVAIEEAERIIKINYIEIVESLTKRRE